VEPERYQWRSVPYAARFFGKTERCIRQWCSSAAGSKARNAGIFAALGVRTYQDSLNRWWILLRDDDSSLT